MEKYDTKPGWYWSQYWSADRLASCFEGPLSNYEQSVQSHWETFFSHLPARCRILDIGTGNGAVPAIANRIDQQRDMKFDITGVDQADIDPQRTLKSNAEAIAGVTFLGLTSASSLPFDDGWFGALASQFALEYMPLAAVLPELSRVAAAGASLQLVVHAVEGVAFSGALAELAHCDFVEKELALFDTVRQVMSFVVALERRSAPVEAKEDARALELVADLDSRLRRLEARRKASGPHLMLDNVQQVVMHLYQRRKTFSPEQLQQHLGIIQSEVEAHAARLRELHAAALDAGGMQDLSAELAAVGFGDLGVQPLSRPDGGAQLGWLLRGVRR